MDRKNIYVQFTAGVGPVECALACEKVFKHFYNMYIDKYHFRIVDEEMDDTAGFRSILIEMPDMPIEDITEVRTTWQGTVRVIATKNSVRPNHKRKNWFVGVNVIDGPADNEVLDMKDVRIDRFRASGAGGQHVNRTESAVRLTHIPTGITVNCQAERSQVRNLEIAKKILLARINEFNKAERDAHTKDIWHNHKTLERGNEIMIIKTEL